MDLIRQFHNPYINIGPSQFEKNHFILHYILTPDCSTDHFSPIVSENVRFEARLQEPLTHLYTCVIITETPRILEINAQRNISIVEATK